MLPKQSETISHGDFDEAVVRLHLNVTEVARETGIPRTYLSEFRNGDRKLRPENLAKLRDYFEAKGIEFEAGAPARGDPASFHPRLGKVVCPSFYFRIRDDLPADIVAKAMDALEENDARLVALLKMNAKFDEPLFADKEFSDDTKAMLQEAIGLLAANYVIFRMLRGWRAFNVTPASEDPQTLRDVLYDTFKQQLTDAGLITPDNTGEGEELGQDAETEGSYA